MVEESSIITCSYNSNQCAYHQNFAPTKHPNTRTPAGEGREFNNFGSSFLGHQYHILTLSALCPRVDKKNRRSIWHYLTYGHAVAQDPLPRGSWNYLCRLDDLRLNICRPFFGHRFYISRLSVLSLGVEKIFNEIIHFHYITYIAMPSIRTPAPGVMKFTI